MAMTGGTAKLVKTGTPSGWPDSIKLYVYYKEKSQDIAKNETVLSLGMYITTPSGWSIGTWDDFYGSYIGTATSGGNCKSFNGTIPSGTMGTRWLVENQDITIKHDDDGQKKNLTVYWKLGVNSPWGGFTIPSGAFNIDLTTIPRASTITSAANVTLGNNCSVTWTPHSASFYYILKFQVGVTSDTTDVIHPNTTASYTYTDYKFLLNLWAKSFTSLDKNTMTVTLYTFSDSKGTKQVGSPDSKTFTATVPDLPPSVSITTSPVSSLPSSFYSVYVQGKSKVKASITAEGQYGATIKSYSLKVDGKTYGQSEDYTSDYLSKYGNLTITGYATDSREDTGSKDATIYVHPYAKPYLTDGVAGRCNASGEFADNGTYLRIDAKRNYSTVGGKNKCEIQYRYKLMSASSYSPWETILSKYAAEDAVITSPLLSGNLSVKSTYEVQIRAIDDIGEYTYTTIKIPTDKVFRHQGWNSICYGGYIEEDDTFAITGDMKFKVKNEVWESLGLSGNVTPSESNCGRGLDGTGCWYRVINGNHVQVAFNCAFGYAGAALQVNLESIPAKYRPQRNVYAICATGGRAVARVLVNNSGNVLVDWIQVISTADTTTASSVSWIDGYIDYYL